MSWRGLFLFINMTIKIINISGEIGWEVTPDKIREQLNGANGADLDVYIASPGGFVFDGIEIFNMFRDYKRKYPESQMSVTLKGLAASMASYLAVNPVFDLIAAEDNAVFMVHNVWGVSVGDYRDMKKTAEIFEGLGDIIGNAYSAKTKKSKKEIKNMMDDETWLFGEEIKTAGFVDEIIKTPEPKEKASAITSARTSVKILSEKLSTQKFDIQKAAAMLRPENSTAAGEPVENKITPALTREKQTEVSMTTLTELLSANPAAKIEYDNALKMENKAGYDKCKAEFDERIKGAVTIMKTETYPAQVKAAALDVIAGIKPLSALDSIVAAADMFVELKKSMDAQNETGAQGETQGQQHQPIAQDGVIKTEADYQAELVRNRALAGMEVK